MLRTFDRVDDGNLFVLKGSRVNDISDSLERYERLTVAPPLMMQDGPSGKLLSVMLPPGVQMFRLSGKSTGTGTYTGRTQQVSTPMQATSTDLNLSAWYTDYATVDDVIIENVPENKNATGTHALTTGADSFVLARPSGRFASDSTPANLPIWECDVNPRGTFAVTVTKDGGSDGTAAPSPTAASWTYTVKDADSGDTLGTVMSPAWARQLGPATPATNGLARYKSTGVFVLLTVDEVIAASGCS